MNEYGTPKNLVPGVRVGQEPLGKTIGLRLPGSWYPELESAAGGNVQQFIRDAIREKLDRAGGGQP